MGLQMEKVFIREKILYVSLVDFSIAVTDNSSQSIHKRILIALR